MAVTVSNTFDADQAQAQVNAQRTALMRAIAEGGKAGAAAYATANAGTQQAVASEGQAATQRAQGSAVQDSPGFAGEQSANMKAISDLYGGYLGNQRDAQQTQSASLGASNSAYMDNVNAAVPIAKQYSDTLIGAVQRQVNDQEAQRAHQRALESMQLEQGRMSLANAREDRAASASGGGLTPNQKADNDRLARNETLKRNDEKASAYAADLDRRWGSVDASGDITGKAGTALSGNSYKAFYEIAELGGDPKAVFARYKTPSGGQLNQAAVMGAVQRYRDLQNAGL